MTSPAETLKAVREALMDLSDELSAEVSHKYGAPDNIHPAMVGRFNRDMEPVVNARKLLAKLDRLEVVEGVAFLDGDSFCTEGEGGKCQEAWLMVPGCEHEPDYKADGGERRALLLTVKEET